jgi:hypothetical protein
MDEMSQEQLVAVLAREMVVQVAPQELPLFRATSQAYFQNPNKLFQGQSPKDEMLGFGAGGAVTLLTPFILSILTEVVKYLASEFASTLKSEGAGYINEMVKASFQKFRRQPQAEAAATGEVDADGGGDQIKPVPIENAADSQTQGGLAQGSVAPGEGGLSKEQLAQIYEIALKKARELKLSESKATLLADSVVGSLALV